MDEEIYRQNIIDHYKKPHNFGVPTSFTVSREGKNMSCGDSMTLYLAIDNGVVVNAAFEGVGCAISQASASMLTDKVKGMTFAELELITPGTVYDMLGISVSPARSKCALLSYEALVGALKEIQDTK